MGEVEEFLASVMPRLIEADTAIHNGDATLRSALWSHSDPVTLFGAAVTKEGWEEISTTFGWLASRLSDCDSFDYEVRAAGASGDLAYVVGIEHTTASVAGSPAASYSLRVTTIFRREAGEWRVVHRHGDPYDAPGEGMVANLSGRGRRS